MEPAEEFLNHVELRAKQSIFAGLTATVVALIALFVAHADQHPTPRLIFGLMLFCGPIVAITARGWLPLLRKARPLLAEPPTDMFLSAQYARTLYGGGRDGAHLWRERDDSLPIAGFSLRRPPWSRPFRLWVTKTPAKVYGSPTRGAVVVVTFADGMLVGRIGQTDYREVSSMGPVGRFLFKDRRLPGS